jgi:hypothetical protein
MRAPLTGGGLAAPASRQAASSPAHVQSTLRRLRPCLARASIRQATTAGYGRFPRPYMNLVKRSSSFVLRAL